MDIGTDTPIGLWAGAILSWEPPPSVMPCGVVTLATGTQWARGWWLAQEGLEVGTGTAREKKCPASLQEAGLKLMLAIWFST